MKRGLPNPRVLASVNRANNARIETSTIASIDVDAMTTAKALGGLKEWTWARWNVPVYVE